MNNSLKVYKMNDCDWMAAHTPEEAAEEYKKQCELTDDEIEYPLAECDLDKDGLIVDINELTEEEANLHKNFKKYGDKLYAWFSFRECLRESDGSPYLIASTEC